MDLLGVLWDVARPLLMILLILGGGALVLYFGGIAVVSVVTIIVSKPIEWIYRTILCFPAKKKIEKNFNSGLEELLRRICSAGVKKIEFTTNSVYLVDANDQRYYYSYADLGYANLPNMRYVYSIAEITNKRLFDNKLYLSELTSKTEGGFVSNGYETTVRSGSFHTREKTEWVSGSSKTYGYMLENFKLTAKKKAVKKIKKW